MNEIAEVFAAEWVVAQVLDDRASVGVCMRLFDLVFGEIRKAMQQERTDLGCPYQIDDFLMSENRVGK